MNEINKMYIDVEADDVHGLEDEYYLDVSFFPN